MLGIMRNEFDMIDLPGTAIFFFALVFVYVLVHVCLRSKIFIVSFCHKKHKCSFEFTQNMLLCKITIVDFPGPEIHIGGSDINVAPGSI